MDLRAAGLKRWRGGPVEERRRLPLGLRSSGVALPVARMHACLRVRETPLVGREEDLDASFSFPRNARHREIQRKMRKGSC